MLKLRNIVGTYSTIKKLACDAINQGDYNRALHYFELAAKIAYTFNWIYSDQDIEQAIKNIAEKLVSRTKISVIRNRVVLFDSFSLDNRGLTQQYIRALISANIEFLYIFGDRKIEESRSISAELMAYPRCTIYSLQTELPCTERIKKLYEVISEYKPEKILLHLTPWALEAIAVMNLVPEITRYQINLTDHAFWLGNTCIDYSFEFRDYGMAVSAEKRQLTKKQLLYLPYYPIISHAAFEGFPIQVKQDTIRILSGGSLYKIYGKNGTYFRLVKNILEENSDCVILFAGVGDFGPIKRFIKKNHFENRFFLLGFRNDINELFKHCDLYLGTYPIAGGLLSQYAAINGKPILAYTTNDLVGNSIESLICHNHDMIVTYTDISSFYANCSKLCTDKTYRDENGQELEKCVITETQFNSAFLTAFQQNCTKEIKNPDLQIDYKAFTDVYIEVQSKYLSYYYDIIKNEFGPTFCFRFPYMLFSYPQKTTGFLLNFLVKKIYRNVSRIKRVIKKLVIRGH